jgi:hypothetical protein
LHLDVVLIGKGSADLIGKSLELVFKIMDLLWARLCNNWDVDFGVFVFNVSIGELLALFDGEVCEGLQFAINFWVFENPEVVKLIDDSQFSGLKDDSVVVNQVVEFVDAVEASSLTLTCNPVLE